MRSKIGAIGAIGLIVPMLITGCSILERPSNSPVAIQRQGDNVAVAFCNAVTVSYVLIEERNLREELPWSIVWEFETNVEISQGDSLSTDPTITSPIPGEIRKIPRLMAGDQVRVFVAHPGPGTRRQAVNSTFYIDEQGLSENDWLHPDGSTTSAPCP